jgi:hypothetical protein
MGQYARRLGMMMGMKVPSDFLGLGTVNTMAPQVAAAPPAGAMNLTVSLGGLDTKADQLAAAVAVEVRNAIVALINEYAGIVRNTGKAMTPRS